MPVGSPRQVTDLIEILEHHMQHTPGFRITCHGCEEDVHGTRYRCQSCHNVDFCSPCFQLAKGSHTGHKFLRLFGPGLKHTDLTKDRRALYTWHSGWIVDDDSDEEDQVHVHVHEDGIESKGYPYHYRPLERPSTVRILRLYPGSSNDPLRADIRHENLDQPSFPFSKTYNAFHGLPQTRTAKRSWDPRASTPRNKYATFEALSYVWGTPDFKYTLITCGGDIAISTNLATALRYIRHPELARDLWIDAVCINQEDVNERGHQVKMMGKIYTLALGVLVWLGEDPNDEAQNILDLLGPNIKPSLAMVTALKRVLSFEWFSRLWVVQEFLLARRVQLVWAHAILDAQWFLDKVFDMPYYHATARWLSIGLTKAPNFLEVLKATEPLVCSDPRDRIYSLMSLEYDPSDSMSSRISKIRPDYAQPAHDVFIEIARLCMEHDRWFPLLPQLGATISDNPGHPSWVPRWDRLKETSVWIPDWQHSGHLGSYLANRSNHLSQSLSPVIERATRNLIITGVRLDTVHSTMNAPLADPQESPSILMSIYAYWIQTLKPLINHKTTLDYAIMETSFLRLLMSNLNNVQSVQYLKHKILGTPGVMLDHEMIYSSCEQDADDIVAMFRALCSSEAITYNQSDSPIQAGTFPTGSPRQWAGRRIFRTGIDMLGLGPSATQNGDIIAVFCDAEQDILWPVILREVQNYHVIIGIALIPMLRRYDIANLEYQRFCIK